MLRQKAFKMIYLLGQIFLFFIIIDVVVIVVGAVFEMLE